MKPSEALAQHRAEALAIIAKFPVSNPRIFGSVARGEDTDDSDLDILVGHAGHLSFFDIFRLEENLSQALGVRVDVRTDGEFSERIMKRLQRDIRPI